MTTLALSMPSPVPAFGDPELVNGLDLTAISGTADAGNATVTFPWFQGVMLYVLGSSSDGTAQVTFVSPNTVYFANYQCTAITQSHAVIYGPLANIWAAPSTGLVTITVAGTLTGVTFKLFGVPTSGVKHNPFEMNGPDQADF